MCVTGSIPVCRLLVSLFGEFGHWLGPIVLSNLGQYCILRVTYNTIFYNFLGHNPEVEVRFFHSPLPIVELRRCKIEARWFACSTTLNMQHDDQLYSCALRNPLIGNGWRYQYTI